MAKATLESLAVASIDLTLAHGNGIRSSGSIVTVPVLQLIAYEQQTGCTRLLLVGRKSVQVKENTDQIDRLVRVASRNQIGPLCVQLAA
jgi:hypothetical protein